MSRKEKERNESGNKGGGAKSGETKKGKGFGKKGKESGKRNNSQDNKPKGPLLEKVSVVIASAARSRGGLPEGAAGLDSWANVFFGARRTS